jgi:hypothetical protein
MQGVTKPAHSAKRSGSPAASPWQIKAYAEIWKVEVFCGCYKRLSCSNESHNGVLSWRGRLGRRLSPLEHISKAGSWEEAAGWTARESKGAGLPKQPALCAIPQATLHHLKGEQANIEFCRAVLRIVVNCMMSVLQRLKQRVRFMTLYVLLTIYALWSSESAGIDSREWNQIRTRIDLILVSDTEFPARWHSIERCLPIASKPLHGIFEVENGHLLTPSLIDKIYVQGSPLYLTNRGLKNRGLGLIIILICQV